MADVDDDLLNRQIDTPQATTEYPKCVDDAAFLETL
jgi:hypothetical protein